MGSSAFSIYNQGMASAKPPPLESFLRLLSQTEEQLDLAEATLLIAQSEYPRLEPEPYLKRLDRMSQEVAGRLERQRDPYAVIETLNHYLFRELEFRGNREDYYDPRNSYLNEVLDRRTGIPITLSVIYMEVGHRLGVPLVGIGLPGHFLVRYAGESREIFIDCFNQGLLLTRADCQARLREIYGEEAQLEDTHLQPVSKRALLFRLLNNLKGIYLGQQRWEKALVILEWMLTIAPNDASLVRDRGLVHVTSGPVHLGNS